MNDNPWKGTNVLITGVCGTVGKELLRQISKLEPESVIGLDNNESELFFLMEEYKTNPIISLSICDIREKSHLLNFFDSVDIVLHVAALKHVIINEKNPGEAILTNIIGTQNVIEAAKATGVGRVIYTSSDKAVNPTNVMGTSKLMGERLITAANTSVKGGKTVFASTRFGNVLGSNGSVIPLFKRQIEQGGPVTLTDPDMSRFIMTLEEAVSLVMESVFLAKGGEVFVTKMPTIRIEDLAISMIRHLAQEKSIEIKIIGAKPGEKLYEELMNEEEVRRTSELERYFVVKPAFKVGGLMLDTLSSYPGFVSDTIDKVYRSDKEEFMKEAELLDYLVTNKII
ncbi:MAG: polysaccharide biosynthesis protein [Roseivirga sp.]|nr:polysaccharide biosynthesis protein [Roseivirga sp.]